MSTIRQTLSNIVLALQSPVEWYSKAHIRDVIKSINVRGEKGRIIIGMPGARSFVSLSLSLALALPLVGALVVLKREIKFQIFKLPVND